MSPILTERNPSERPTAPTLNWKAVHSHVAEGPAEVRHVDGWLVCEVPADSYANLIAAAPQMLEALRWIRKSLGWQYIPTETRNEIRAAISAAEGK